MGAAGAGVAISTQRVVSVMLMIRNVLNIVLLHGWWLDPMIVIAIGPDWLSPSLSLLSIVRAKAGKTMDVLQRVKATVTCIVIAEVKTRSIYPHLDRTNLDSAKDTLLVHHISQNGNACKGFK